MAAKFSDNRRTFLKHAVLIGGSAVGLALAAKAEAKENPPAVQPEPEAQGYRLTEHIRKYYRTAGS